LKSEGGEGRETLEARMPKREEGAAETEVPRPKHSARYSTSSQGEIAAGGAIESQKEQKRIDSQKTPRAGTIERGVAEAETGVEPSHPTGGARIKQGAVNGEGNAVKNKKIEGQKNIQGGLEKIKPEASKGFVAGRKEIEQKFFSVQDGAVKTKEAPVQESPFFDKPPAPEDEGDRAKREKPLSKKSDESIFNGEEEISRINLRQKMRTDPKIWMEQKKAGLNLNYIERARLEKEIFPSVLGGNISKTDLKWGVKKLGQKMLSTKDPKQHEKLRKEIKFLKKIGGIK